jgi:hypothetical protein
MTRQYESEVPVRLQLIVDGSMSTRHGGFGQRLLDQLVNTAASAARAAISSGDAVGVVVFDERGEQRLAPVSVDRGFYRVLQMLSDFAVNPAPLPDRLSPLLQQTALAVCREQYPELLERQVNQVPWTIFPILPWSRRRYHARCRLAGVLAELYSMSPDRHVQLLSDDAFLAAFAQHFLSQSGLTWLTPAFHRPGRDFEPPADVSTEGLLVAGLTVLLIRDFPRAGRFETADAVTWTFLLSAVVMFGFRQRRELQQLSSRSIRSIFRDAFGAAVESVSGNEGGFDELTEAAPAGLADRLLGSGVQAIRGLLLLLACTVTAALLLEWLPRGATLSRAVREFAAEDPELSGVALLATIVAGALQLTGELSWRLLTPAQARMYLRSQRLQLFFPDLSMLSRGRQRERLRRVRGQSTDGGRGMSAGLLLE